MNPIDEKRTQRFALLSALYDDDEASGGRPADMVAIGTRLGLAPEVTTVHIRFLAADSLVDLLNFDNNDFIVTISHRGRNEVEQARSAPERPTEHFPPHVTINVREMHHSQIQAGTHGSSQHFAITDNDLKAVGEFVSSVREHMCTADLQAEAKSHMTAEIATIDAQLGSPRPRRKAIGESLEELRTILEGAAVGTGLAAVYLPQLRPLLDRFAS